MDARCLRWWPLQERRAGRHSTELANGRPDQGGAVDLIACRRYGEARRFVETTPTAPSAVPGPRGRLNSVRANKGAHVVGNSLFDF